VNGVTSATSSSLTVNGKITATFTWQTNNLANDPPPTSVVIYEEEQTESGGSSTNPNAVPTEATCSDDLGFAFVPANTKTSPYINFGGSAGGVRYQIKQNPGTSFTLTTSPTATLSAKGAVGPPIGNSGNGGGGDIRVGYKATATPLELVLSGGIGPSNAKRFLIGQQVTGTLSTGGLTASGFNWTVSGGEPFKNWIFTDTWNAATTFTGFGTQTGSALAFCFRKVASSGTQETVSCSLHLAVPIGALPSAGLNPNLSRDCTVDIPNKTLSVYIGNAQGIADFFVPRPINPLGMQLLGSVDPNHMGKPAGTWWDGTITTPVEYGAGGGWNYTQLITLHRLEKTAKGDVTIPPIVNDIQTLDTQFGYAPKYPALYSDDGSTNSSNDSPAQLFGVYSYVEVLDSFYTYMLYRPPGTGSQFVPIKDFKWYWQG